MELTFLTTFVAIFILLSIIVECEQYLVAFQGFVIWFFVDFRLLNCILVKIRENSISSVLIDSYVLNRERWVVLESAVLELLLINHMIVGHVHCEDSVAHQVAFAIVSTALVAATRVV